MLVSSMHPVAILRAVFGIICSVSMLVSDALGDHIIDHLELHTMHILNVSHQKDSYL